MSRIGKKPIDVPSGAKISVTNSVCNVEGPKGKLVFDIPANIKVEIKDNKVLVSRSSDIKQDKMSHGMVRSTVNNMLIGVTQGYTKDLEIVGVGFKAAVAGKVLSLQLSYTHPVDYTIPDGVTVETPKPTIIAIKGANKALVGKVAAEIRDYYRPEPYKGKGIKYAGEQIRRKAGKSVAGAAGGTGGK